LTKIVFLLLDRDTEQARVVDIMMARAKRIYMKVYMNLRESLGELEKAVETLAYGSCTHSISRSPKLPLAFLFNN